jgi:phosphohistidine phosphatase
MKTLLLMRHAKSDWDADYGSDHDRPLSDRGVRSACVIGRLLKGRDNQPEYAISSTANRARSTVELAAEAGGWDCAIRLESAFYGSGPETVLRLAASAPAVGRLMLVGHQPTWSMLVNRLTGARSEMKTGAVAEIELMIDSWSELYAAQGVLVGLHVPRTYFGSEWDDVPGSTS